MGWVRFFNCFFPFLKEGRGTRCSVSALVHVRAIDLPRAGRRHASLDM